MTQQQTQQVKNIQTVQTSFALKKLQGIKPKGIKVKDDSAFGSLVDVCNSIFDADLIIEDFMGRVNNHGTFSNIRDYSAENLNEVNFNNADLTNFIKTVNKEGIVSILKKLGAYITINQSNFCIPAIWILIAVEMDPKTYSNVIEWFLTETDVLDDVGTLF